MNKSIILGGALASAVAVTTSIVNQIARSRRNKEDAKWREAIAAYKVARERNAPEVEIEQARQQLGQIFRQRQAGQAR